LLLVGLLVVGVFAGLLAYGDVGQMAALLSRFPPGWFAAAAGLAVLNYALRYCRWFMYLRVLEIGVPHSVAAPIFVAGLTLSITPGKVGELLKSVWLRQRAAVPVAQSAPAVVMERLTDVIGVALLALIGLTLLPPIIALLLGGVVAFGLVAGTVAASRYGLALLRLPVLRRWQEPLAQSQYGMQRLMSPAVLAAAVCLSGLAWAAEGAALWVIVIGLNEHLPLSLALPISAMAALAGAATALPGGLIGFEGSMVALLWQAGVAAAAASTATLLTRLATLWLAVLVGLLGWLWLSGTRPGAGELGGTHDSRGSADE
jgi:uncharacterized membrane protein YbhN (UPF0104 family)